MLGERLKKLRISANKTQHEIADYLQITRPAYTQYELDKREPDFKTLKKLADYHGCSTDYLLERIEIKKVNSTDERDIKRKQFEELIDKLSDEQLELLLANLKTLAERNR